MQARPKKSLGQNFLIHRQIAERIVHASGVTESDIVLEIGPGTGMLTRALLAKAWKVVAIEADAELVIGLKDSFSEEISTEKLTLLSADVRSYDPYTLTGDYLLVANIPYYLTGELFRKFLTADHKPKSITFLVQKEVAERIARSKKESLLSLSIKAFGTPTYCFTVPKGAFFPAPTIDSAVISIKNIHSPFSSAQEEAAFFTLIHAGFAHKRKQLGGNLSEIASKDEVQQALLKAGISPKARAEDLPLSSWMILTKIIHTKFTIAQNT
jgi:16S rRNA (adenine1518-N6/adenine1519-N6)-dimethyltransferase